MKRLAAICLLLVMTGALLGVGVKKSSPNFGYPDGKPGQNEIQEIVIHHWGPDASTFTGTEGWLCNPASEVSAHYVVSGTTVHRLMPLENAAWHSGVRWHNMHSVGIECDPRCSRQDMETVAALIAEIWQENGGTTPIIGHCDVAATECPGRWYERIDELTEMAQAIYDRAA